MLSTEFVIKHDPSVMAALYQCIKDAERIDDFSQWHLEDKMALFRRLFEITSVVLRERERQLQSFYDNFDTNSKQLILDMSAEHLVQRSMQLQEKILSSYPV